MRVEEVELRRLDLPLVTDFTTAHGSRRSRALLLVRVRSAEGVSGWGECVALEEPSYSPETVDTAALVLRRHLAALLFEGRDLDAVKGHPMAKAALRTAVLDAALRVEGRSLADHLGAVADRVPAGVAIGMTGSVPELVDVVAGYVAEGYRRVKLKVVPGFDVEPATAVRSAFPGLPLQVDGNGSYSLAEAVARLAPLDDLDLLLVEQPLADDDLVGHADLARHLRTPICLDESLTGVDVTRTALALGAAEVVNLKPGRVGGLEEARAIHDLCVERAVPLWCGGMLETGIGRAVNIALAALPGFTLPGDLSASGRWYDPDLITEPFVLDEDGHLPVPTGPGIGVEVDVDAVDRLTTAVEVLRPG